MINISEFLTTILKKILKKPIVSKDYGSDHHISRNTFSYYIKNNSPLTETVSEALKQIILDEIANDSSKEQKLINYLKKFLIGDEKNISNTYKIIETVLSKITNGNSNFTKRTSIRDKEAYANKIKLMFEMTTGYFQDEPSTALICTEKIMKIIQENLLKFEKIVSKTNDRIELLYSKNIIPKNIYVAMKNTQNILSVADESEERIPEAFYESCYLDLKVIVKWYVNQYLKSDLHEVESDLMRRNEKLKIIDLSELLRNGWTIKQYMENCFRMWEESIDNCIPEEHFGDIEQWVSVINTNIDNPKILLNEKDEFVGFYDFTALFREPFEKLKNGEFLEDELAVDMIPTMIQGTYDIYFIGICLQKEYRKTVALQKILFSVIDKFEELALNGIFINEICAWAYSDSGISLCKSLGMKYLRDHTEQGQIYWGTIFDFLNQPICKKCVTLKKLYSENEDLSAHSK